MLLLLLLCTVLLLPSEAVNILLPNISPPSPSSASSSPQQQQLHYQQQEQEEEILLMHMQHSSEKQQQQQRTDNHHHHHHHQFRLQAHKPQHNPQRLGDLENQLQTNIQDSDIRVNLVSTRGDRHGQELRRQEHKQRRIPKKINDYKARTIDPIDNSLDEEYSININTRNRLDFHEQPFELLNQLEPSELGDLPKNRNDVTDSDIGGIEKGVKYQLQIVKKKGRGSEKTNEIINSSPRNDHHKKFFSDIEKSGQSRNMTRIETKPSCKQATAASSYRQCSEPEEPPECCKCGATFDEIVNSTVQSEFDSNSLDCDNLNKVGQSHGTCQRSKDGNCCSSVMSLAALTDMVAKLEESKREEKESQSLDSNPENILQKEPFQNRDKKCMPKQCLHIRNNTCSQKNNSTGKDNKKVCLTNESFPNENDGSCCLTEYLELFPFSLQHCRKFPIMRVLWPRAFVKSTDECASSGYSQRNPPSSIISEPSDDLNSTEHVFVSQRALRHLLERDRHIGRVLHQYTKILQRMDCNANFSVIHNCSTCEVSYIQVQVRSVKVQVSYRCGKLHSMIDVQFSIVFLIIPLKIFYFTNV